MTPMMRGWDVEAFFDKRVQGILRQSRDIIAAAVPGGPAATAWPVIVFQATVELANELPAKTGRHSDWLRMYSEDPVFASALLRAVTQFHRTPEREWPLARGLAHYVPTLYEPDQIGPGDWPPNFFPLRNPDLCEWGDIRERLKKPFKKSIGHLKKEWSEEVRRRNKIMADWLDSWTAAHHSRREAVHCPVYGGTVTKCGKNW